MWFLPWFVASLVRLLAFTWRVRRVNAELLEDALRDGPTVLAFFHEDQVPLIALHQRRGFVAVASLSRDGELLARTVGHLGYGTVRGSSSRGGAYALLGCVRAMLRDRRHVGFAVDGPRGPRRVPHTGAVRLARATERPIIFAVANCSHSWRARSWDRLAVPWPFARVQVVYGRLVPEPGEDAQEASARLGGELVGCYGSS